MSTSHQFSRRTVLTSVVAGALIETLPAPARAMNPATVGKPSFELGIASYTFRKFDDKTLIASLKTLGCTRLNVKDLHLPMEPITEVASRADAYRKAGLSLTTGGTINFPNPDVADIRKKFDYAKAAGLKVIVSAPTHVTLPMLEPFVREYDIRVAVHNHGPEDKFFPSPLDVLKEVGKLDARIGCCVDVGHALRAGDDVVAMLRKVGPRLFDVHMKDLSDRSSKESQVAVGDGLMPIREIFVELNKMGYTGGVDLEYEIFPADPMPGVIKSFAYMRGVLVGLGYKA